MKNTLRKGTIRCLIYQSPEEGIYYGTVLELNLTTSSDNKEEVILQMEEQVGEYIETAREKNAPELLNQEVDKELEDMWHAMINAETKMKISTSAETPLVPISAIRTAIPAPA